jgi:putative acetyltransferase
MLTIAQETARQDDVLGLLRQADARAAALYPAESRYGPAVDDLLAQDVRLVVARLDGRAVGCGGFAPGAHGQAELKRLFVELSARGNGIGRVILQTVEDAARREGIRLLQLETGVKSPVALTLYRRFGYRERGPPRPSVVGAVADRHPSSVAPDGPDDHCARVRSQ